jgi:quercetin dioxygenase-like cupin family protein
MPIDLYQPFTNPVTRETFRCLASTPEAYKMEWTVAPGGRVPFEHVHMYQDEVFHVQRGEMRAMVAGRPQIGRAGQVLTAPRGIRHIAFNDRDEDLVCLVEYKPGLDHYTTMQCFAGLTLDHDLDARGMVNVPKIMYLLRRANAQSLPRPAFVPPSMFRLGMEFFFRLGTLMGWQRLYTQYTGRSLQEMTA